MNAVTSDSSPGRDRVKDRSSVLPSRHLRRLVSACSYAQHALRASRTLKIPLAFGRSRPKARRWHDDTQITRKCGGIIQTVIAAAPVEEEECTRVYRTLLRRGSSVSSPRGHVTLTNRYNPTACCNELILISSLRVTFKTTAIFRLPSSPSASTAGMKFPPQSCEASQRFLSFQ